MSAAVEWSPIDHNPDQIDLEDAIAGVLGIARQTAATAMFIPAAVATVRVARRKTTRVVRDARAAAKRSTERSVRCERVRAGAIAKGMSLGYVKGLTTDALAAYVSARQCKERLAKALEGGK